MPEKFQYPEKAWSEGRMRMAKAGPRSDPGKEYRELEGIRKKKEQIISQAPGQFPEMDKNEWTTWGEDPNVHTMYAGKSMDLMKTLEHNPQGFMVDHDHKGVQGLGESADVFTIPDMKDTLFVRPRKTQPLTSEAGSGTGVV